jgi:hypothetical protein
LEGFPDQIKNQLPANVLPHQKIPNKAISLTTRIDTFRKDEIFKTLDSPRLIVFVKDKKEGDQYIAIEREKDWAVIHYGIFKQLAPAGLTFEWIKFKNSKTPFLLASFDSQLTQRIGSYSEYEDIVMGFSELTKRAKGCCLIDAEKLTLLLDNVFTGYEYTFSLWQKFREPNPDKADEYHHGSKNRLDCTRNLWYDFKFDLEKGQISVKKGFCEDKMVKNESLKYDSEELDKIKGVKKPDQTIICSQSKCEPMLKEGVYQWDGNCFRRK